MSEEMMRQEEALTAPEIRAQVNRIQEVMNAVMKKDVHYGTIPGCGDKPALFKPGAEKLLSTFRIAIEPVVTDLSIPDEVHYRIEARATSMALGGYLGSGIGEASSNEEKYQWRKSVCDEEFEATPEDRRRVKWGKYYGKISQLKQVRTNPADIANTVLKMAKKRAIVDACLTVTAASDCFTQDIEDLPAEFATNHEAEHKPDIKKPQPKDKANDDKPKAVNLISEKQRKYLFVQADKANVSDDILHIYLRELGIEHTKDIPKSSFDKLLAWVEAGGQDIPS